jgi:drug/metabolite transporter (DMT)-like permease
LGLSLVPQIPMLWFDQKALGSGFDSVSGSGWIALAYLILFATALGQQAWLYGVKRIGPSRAGVFINLIPVSALALSTMILGELIGLREVAGVALTLAGVWMVNRRSQSFS